jgi:hypothetical protein
VGDSSGAVPQPAAAVNASATQASAAIRPGTVSPA